MLVLHQRSMPIPFSNSRIRLALVVLGNAFVRIASGASGILVGLYLADLANRGFGINAALVGTLGAVSFTSELILSIPTGIASDAVAPRALMTGGALLGAMATQLFGLSSQLSVFFLSRGVEGAGAAAVTPSLLSHLTDVTSGDHSLRARVMSYFELSLLGGLGLGGLTGAQLWHFLSVRAFSAVAVIYVLAACLLALGAAGSRGYGSAKAISGLYIALREPSLQRLAPTWLCVNTIVGLWLGPTLPFLLTRKGHGNQYLDGIFSNRPEQVGWLLLGYTFIFGVGVTMWSFALPRMTERRALRIALAAMLGVCFGLFLLNHSADRSVSARWTLVTVTALCIMVESGFTPAALSLLAGAIGAHAGRGAAMGIYSVLLSVGTIVGSLLAAALGQGFAVDGLIYATFAMAVIGLFFVRWLVVTNSKDCLDAETTV